MTSIDTHQTVDGAATYLGSGDPTRRRSDYYPAWLDSASPVSWPTSSPAPPVPGTSSPTSRESARPEAQAMISTRRSSGVIRPSTRSTSRSARIDTSIWSSVGSRVVRR